jgi:undecaprenyl-diphosphatase
MQQPLHSHPPFTPRGLLLSHPAVRWIVAGTALALALAAAIDGASLLLTWDEPIQRWVEARRTPGWDGLFRGFSRMGSNLVVFAGFAVLVIAAARRCRTLAIALAIAVLARPVFEFFLKGAVGRDRPNLSRLVDGTGASFPSGHVLAAVTLWGLLPPLVALITNRRWVWWATTAVSGVLIVGNSASRVYLGVHWFSDIIGGLLIGWLYLTVIETIYTHHHRGRSCDGETLPTEVTVSADSLS